MSIHNSDAKRYPCFRVKPRLRGPAQSGGDTSDQSDSKIKGHP